MVLLALSTATVARPASAGAAFEPPSEIRTVTAAETPTEIGHAAAVRSAAGENTGRLSGRVTDEAGNPIMDATITVNGTGGKTTPSSDGYYRLKLPEGTYEVTISADGFQRETATVTVTSSDWARLDVTLSVPTTAVFGTVRNETGTPIENATVAIRSVGAETVTRSDGAYELVVPRERHTLEVSAAGYDSQRVVIETENRRSLERNVTLALEIDEEANGTTNESVTNETPDSDTANETVAEDESGADSEQPAAGKSPFLYRPLDLLLFASLFLAVLVTATLVGLYRDRSYRS
ncbi:carboxypeptidase regulatory-like domain-containing protein [Natrinema salaciae]|nr:carboxypeptidase regulatory-like domain-containing protein [Natrinema salaciae]